MGYLTEAKDISNYKILDPKLDDIYQKDELVKAWHGTSMFWALWFCMRGVDTTVEPPNKTLGRGTIETGFGKIETKGLFVSADKTSGFKTLVQFEVKPSELGISLEMEQRGYKPEQILNSLVAGDCIVVKNLPAKRVIQVRYNNEVYSRKEFIAKFPYPEQYLENEYRQNMLSGTTLKSKYEKDILYKEFKKEIASGNMTVQEGIKEVQDAIKNNELKFWGVTEDDALEIIEWLKKQLKENKRMIEIKEEVQIGNIILEKGDKIKVLKESSQWETKFVLETPTGKRVYDSTIAQLMTFIMQSYTWDEINDMINEKAYINIVVDGEVMGNIPLEGLVPDHYNKGY